MQEGAQKVAAAAKIHSIKLNTDPTTQEFAPSFLAKLYVSQPSVERKGIVGSSCPEH